MRSCSRSRRGKASIRWLTRMMPAIEYANSGQALPFTRARRRRWTSAVPQSSTGIRRPRASRRPGRRLSTPALCYGQIDSRL